MKLVPYWKTSKNSGDPLLLIKVIQKHILTQNDDIYKFASLYKHEQTIHTFHQNKLTNDQWYEKFDTKYDVINAIGVTRQHKVILYHVAHENHSDVF